MSRVLIPQERRADETRVAATPETVKKLVALGLEVTVERGAGERSHFPDAEYEAAGAALHDEPVAPWGEADAVLKVQAPDLDDATERAQVEALRPGSLVAAFLAPHRNAALAAKLASGRVSSLAVELIPRITRAQSMDALSSQASIAGYKAAIVAAARLGRYFPLLMTAAGTVRPARVVVMGAGVAGLQALATARRLGAVVEVTDIRPVVKEQVESLGGRFIDLPQMESGEGTGGYAKEMGEEFLRRQREVLTERIAASNVVITTALIPGKPAPRLVTREMVEAMRPGSVIVDLAGEQGGNCELSEPGGEAEHGGVLILAPTDLPATLPHDASMLYARNLLELLSLAVGEGGSIALPADDEIVAGALWTHDGEIVHRPTAEKAAEVTTS